MGAGGRNGLARPAQLECSRNDQAGSKIAADGLEEDVNERDGRGGVGLLGDRSQHKSHKWRALQLPTSLQLALADEFNSPVPTITKRKQQTSSGKRRMNKVHFH
ncbi:hypothetical protein Cni_G14670 [Canna indica]|uniref:Uncharacterized protein n=1 Tax=Canna indica TaxID=4628 RepID=A0AAQ3QCK8_9LILI|nr:hypothetical protein Cni_G14670 [Canna indica]